MLIFKKKKGNKLNCTHLREVVFVVWVSWHVCLEACRHVSVNTVLQLLFHYTQLFLLCLFTTDLNYVIIAMIL